MIILFSIIIFHLLAIWAGRNLKEINVKGVVFLIILTFLLVSTVLYGLLSMENPEVT